MKYRPLAPDDLDKAVGDLKRLMGETVLPWHFDAKKKVFVVEQDGKLHPVTFAQGDTETLLVELVTQALPLLLRAIEDRFVIIDREWICRAKVPTDQTPPTARSPAPAASDPEPSASDPAPAKRPVRRTRSRKR